MAHSERRGRGNVSTHIQFMHPKPIVSFSSTTSKPERIVETLRTPDLPDLTAEEITAIETNGSKQHNRIFMKHVFGE